MAVGGFGLCGIPEALIATLMSRVLRCSWARARTGLSNWLIGWDPALWFSLGTKAICHSRFTR
ncbi:hypothetical protein [Pseudomonas fluorescens]|uniref:hypothetical protein n=1 Tax=Pseudomonas fluorescens TaxID=294 RepID=UPI0012402567|nr:hypothetical protein [Pseudomonas fluorescens]